MKDYKMTIGLEIHAELKTKSKMFCGCTNLPDRQAGKTPNLHVCPICMGYPGTLPVINKEAVKKVLLVGVAAGGQIADFTEFDRKNYFYPDIPKGYQLSQYKHPLVKGGSIKGVAITRIHLEEDTARSLHGSGGNFQFPISNFQPNSNENSLVDFNRAGVPLMELVTEPVITGSKEAMDFAKELQLILQYLDVSDANMEKGEMRVEINISVSNSTIFGTKVEVKNINSFRAAGKAIDFEYSRQKAMLEKGDAVLQETRGWDENKEITFSQRLKESAHDYRYFPDPDLPKLLISEIADFTVSKLKESLVELPQDKRDRFAKDFGLKSEDIETYINNPEAGKFFELVAGDLKEVGKDAILLASNYLTSDVVGLSKSVDKDFSLEKLTSKNFSKLISMIKKGDLSSRGAKDTLKVIFEEGTDPETVAQEKGLIQKNNIEEIKALAEKILNSNPKVAEEYNSGKESLLQFFIGVGMKESKGSINPQVLKEEILKILKKDK